MGTAIFLLACLGVWLFYNLTSKGQRTDWAWKFWTLLIIGAGIGTLVEFLG